MGLQPHPPPAPPSPAPLVAAAASALKRKAAAASPAEPTDEAKKQCLDDSAVSMDVSGEEEEVSGSGGGSTETNPKVIVEHQPLPSIYELQQNNAAEESNGGNAPNAELLNAVADTTTAENAEYDSGMSDESNSCEDDEEEEEEEEEEESDVADDEDEDDEDDDDEEDEDDDIPAMASPLYNSVLRYVYVI